jgi:hypothetical protein
VLFAAPGFEISGIAWLLLSILAALFTKRGLLELSGQSKHPHRHLMFLAAFVSTIYYCQWDFRAVNCNMMNLALVIGSLCLLRRLKPGLASFLLSCSVSLKLYSVVLVPYFLFKRRYGFVVLTLIWLVGFFLVAPIVYFGLPEFVEVYGGWIDSVLTTTDPEFSLKFGAFQTSLSHVLLGLFSERGGSGVTNIASFDVHTVWLATKIIQVLWLSSLAAYFIRERGRSCHGNESLVELTNVGILLVGILLVSPQVQPHHGVVLLIPALVMSKFIFDSSQPILLRYGLTGILVVTTLGLKLCSTSVAKGVGMNLIVVVFCLTLSVLRLTRMTDREAGRTLPEAISPVDEPLLA